MSRFFTKTLEELEPYVPGEQPLGREYVKLNTNESPFAPSEEAMREAARILRPLNLYPDPECRLLTGKIAEMYEAEPSSVIPGNGSDELLYFAMRAFGDDMHPAVFPDITYGFYPVFAKINKVPYEEIPLGDDLAIDIEDYIAKKGTIFLANPNAPTGRIIGLRELCGILDSRPDCVTVVDEAYIDFGGESAVGLTKCYDNLLVIQTFSKSRSLAGARIGFAIGSEALISDLRTVKYSFNPYNINSMTMALAYAVLLDEERVRENCRRIMATREMTGERLRGLGFEVIPSAANFIFARHPEIGGDELYRELKDRGVLVRHFDKARIRDYIRISIGTDEDMEVLFAKSEEIL